jgi:hypothetical protein
MSTYEISQVYGFTIKNSELLKIILNKLNEDPDFAGAYETYDSVNGIDNTDHDDLELQNDIAREDEWTHNGKFYDFIEFSQHFGLGPYNTTDGQQKAHILFPLLPTGVKLFHTIIDETNVWYIGIEISYNETNFHSRRKKISKSNLLDYAENYEPTLLNLRNTYRHILNQEQPRIFEIINESD